MVTFNSTGFSNLFVTLYNKIHVLNSTGNARCEHSHATAFCLIQPPSHPPSKELACEYTYTSFNQYSNVNDDPPDYP